MLCVVCPLVLLARLAMSLRLALAQSSFGMIRSPLRHTPTTVRTYSQKNSVYVPSLSVRAAKSCDLHHDWLVWRDWRQAGPI